jgi:hypothetical protein
MSNEESIVGNGDISGALYLFDIVSHSLVLSGLTCFAKTNSLGIKSRK